MVKDPGVQILEQEFSSSLALRIPGHSADGSEGTSFEQFSDEPEGGEEARLSIAVLC